MQIDELFKKVNDIIRESDLIPITKFKNSKNLKIPFSRIVKATKYLEEDIKNFYINQNSYTPYCYYNGYVYIDIHSFDIEDLKIFEIKEKIKAQHKKYNELVENKKFNTLFFYIDQRMSFIVYKKVFDLIPENRRFDLFMDIYTRLDYGFDYFDVGFIRKIFKYKVVTREKLLKKLYKHYNNEYITIYRGVTKKSKSPKNSYSWTIDMNVALCFATRFDIGGKIYEAKVNINDIVYYTNSRKEKEVIVLPESVKDINEIKQLNSQEVLNSNVITRYDRFVKKTNPFLFTNPNGIHGTTHCKRVLLLSSVLSCFNDLSEFDSNLLSYASLYHDIGRKHDKYCIMHGIYSFKKAMQLKLIPKTYLRDETLKYIIENHCINDNLAFKNIDNYIIKDKEKALYLFKIFKDCDNLDRARIKDLDINYLRNDFSKKLLVVSYEFLKGIK